MTSPTVPAGPRLARPRAAAVAGVVFACLTITGLALIRSAVPVSPGESGLWMADPARRRAVQYAVQLFPIAGIAFLWLMGVLRDRLGAHEDRFFATVFLGSGLLFVASLFASAAIGTALLDLVTAGNAPAPGTDIYRLARRASYVFMNVFAIKMGGVFMFSTCVMAVRTAFLPRWLAYSGFFCGLALIVVITTWEWIALLFPVWILVLSIYMLMADMRRH